jgi:acyl transferase domain-containing protein
MADVSSRIASLSPEQRALLERQLRAEGGLVSARTRGEPIAIVGMGCRFPGPAVSPEAFWRLLKDGIDAVSEVPRARWDVDAIYDPNPEVPGKMCTRWGGFLQRVEEFDAAFFGISPREAARMDPQQRLLLEVAWEALEDAGQATERLAGRAAGVFVGIHSLSSDYYLRQAGSLRDVDVYTSTGVAHSIVANRLSYLLDLSGPSLAVDTACSSSLVAVHLACQSLRLGECDLALAGGVNLILSPEVTVALSKLSMMAQDGRCKTFDARADGFVRSEGCGIVVLRRLADAQAEGDPIVAVIRGTAVNQDGATNGITAPSGLAQRAVVRRAIENGGVEAGSVSYVETHGTGTALGDPIEVEALAEALGRGEGPCVLGAVKSNIGHLEAAAGIAGLIKAALCLRHRFLPPNLHFHTLNPHIELAGTRFVIPTEGQPWTSANGALRLAGVSSFGFGGTNAHVVLEEAPAAPAAAEVSTRPLPLCLSARSGQALRALSADYAAFLADPERGGALRLIDVAYTAAVRRSHYPQRAAVVGASREEWIAALERFAARPLRPSPVENHVGLVFVYSGQGSQWSGMGLDLYRTQAVFREWLERAEAELRRLAGWSLLDALGAPARLRRTDVAQPALVALQAALTELLRGWGVEPEAVLGHSAGEVVAAHAAGALGFEEALRVAVERGRLMQAAAGQGDMVAVELAVEEAERVLAVQGMGLEVASVNSPTSTVISGEAGPLEALLGSLETRGVYCKRLNVGFAFHSRQMEPFQEELVRKLRGLLPGRPRLPIFSTLSGRRAEEGDYGPDYWARGIRERVRFAEAVAACAREGRGVFLEIGPHPVLGPMIRRCGVAVGRDLMPLATLRRSEDDAKAMQEALCGLYRLGHPVDWSRCLPRGGRAVRLPTYPWQRERYWVEGATPLGEAKRERRIHPLLGRRVGSALKEVLFEAAIGPRSLPFLADHRVYGAAVLPATGYLEMAQAAAAEVLGPGPHVIEDLVISEALVFPPGEDRVVQVIVTPDGSGLASIQVSSREGGGEGAPERWRSHAAARVSRAAMGRVAVPESLAALQGRCSREVAVEAHYEALRVAGIEFGPSFRGMAGLWRGEGEALGRVRLPQALEGTGGYQMHPAQLDACVQVVGAAAWGQGGGGEPPGVYLPVSLERLRVHAPGGSEVWSHVRLRGGEGDERPTLVGDLRLFDEGGQLVAELEGLSLRRATPEALHRAVEPPSAEWLFEVAWRPQPLAGEATGEAVARTGKWLVLADHGGLGEELARRWRERGEPALVVALTEDGYGVLHRPYTPGGLPAVPARCGGRRAPCGGGAPVEPRGTGVREGGRAAAGHGRGVRESPAPGSGAGGGWRRGAAKAVGGDAGSAGGGGTAGRGAGPGCSVGPGADDRGGAPGAAVRLRRLGPGGGAGDGRVALGGDRSGREGGSDGVPSGAAPCGALGPEPCSRCPEPTGGAGYRHPGDSGRAPPATGLPPSARTRRGGDPGPGRGAQLPRRSERSRRV